MRQENLRSKEVLEQVNKCGLYRKNMTPVVDSENSQEVIQELKSGASFLDGSRGKEATLEYIDISIRDVCGILEK